METETVETYDQILYDIAPFNIGINYHDTYAEYTNIETGKTFLVDYDHDYKLSYIAQKIA